MKNIILSCITLITVVIAGGQSNSDNSFDKRLNEYLRLNRELNFEKLMDYTHPRIFQLASKEQLVEVLSSAYNNPAFAMTLDSISITDISLPFKVENSDYRKIEYRMIAGMKFKDSTIFSGKEDIDRMIEQLETGFHGGDITYDENSGWFRINATTIMFAIKDTDKPWLFLGYEKDSPQMGKMYPPEVISHFKL